MAKRLFTVLTVVLLIVCLAVFSYADLPDGYTELQYIQSTGTQWINTGIGSNHKIVMDVQFNHLTADEQLMGQSLSAGYYFGIDSEDYLINGNSRRFSYLGTDRHTITIVGTSNQQTITVEGESLTSNRVASVSSPFLLGGFTSYSCSVKIFSCQFYNGNTLILDFVPCQNQNGEIGLYDKVEGVFYSNSGTGTFIAGPLLVPPEPEYTISVSDDGNGSASSDVSIATAGTTVTLTATPDDGYVFSEWQVLQGDVNIVNNQFIMPSSDVSVKAVFVPDGAYSVTVQNDGFGTGSANPVRAQAGDRITLSAVPALGYEFDKWQVISGSVNISNNQFIMPDSDVVVKALFKPIVYTITLNQGLHGTATVSQTTGIIGDVITLTATPDEKYNFSHWNIIQGDISIDNNQFIMPASNVVIEPVFLEISAISSGFKYNSGRIDGSYSSHYDVLDINFGDVPAGDYLLNIYHWGGASNARFGLYYGDKYLGFSSADGLSTTAIEHKGGEFRLQGGLDLIRASTVSAEAHVVWISNYGGSGTLDLDNPTTWTFNIEDVVLIPVDVSHLEDYGSVSSLVAFLRDSFDNFKGFLTEQIGRIAGDQEAESDVSQAEEELNKEVEDLNNLSGQLDEQGANLEQQFESDFAVPDEVIGNTNSIQAIYDFLFTSLGIFSIFIWLPVVLAVIKKLLRL